jgi:hypothetical protein
LPFLLWLIETMPTNYTMQIDNKFDIELANLIDIAFQFTINFSYLFLY